MIASLVLLIPTCIVTYKNFSPLLFELPPVGMLKNALNPFASSTFKGKDAMFYTERSTIDTVPVTWE